MEDPTAKAAQPKLHCLRGQPAPPEIGGDLRRLLGLPMAARQQLYRVLGPCLADPVPSTTEAGIDRFCDEFTLSGAELALALRACRFLLRHAAALDLSAARFSEDLARLCDGDEIAAILLPGYEAAKTMVKAEIAAGALSDHGRLVERIDWRLDHVTTSNRGEALKVAVTVLTLGYREGGRHDRITLQLLPDALRELRAMCDRLLA